MSTHTTLELLLKDILGVINPSSHDRSVRNDIIYQLRDIVRDVKGLRGAIVKPYGSFLSNLYTLWGDLDISIDLEGADEQNILKRVYRALREEGYNQVEFVRFAKVPVVKFETFQSVSCDISVNNLSGQMKSKFLYWISDIDPRFRDLVLLVKEWAKSQNINDPTHGTFNSYSLTLLVIFHFQVKSPSYSNVSNKNALLTLLYLREATTKVGASRSSHQLTRGNSSMPEPINRFNDTPLYQRSTQPDWDFYQSSCTSSGSSTGQVSEVQEKKSGWLSCAVSVLVRAAAVAAAVVVVSAILMGDD